MTSKDHELIGNYEVGEKDYVTRRDVLIMGALAAGGLVTAAAPALAAPQVSAATVSTASEPYVAKDFSGLSGKLDGFTASQIDQHIKLYKGYIGKANEITSKLRDADLANANATYSPLRELLVEESYAVNGVVFHELYFGNLGGKGGEPTGDLQAAIDERWGSHAKFIDYVKAAGKCMRGWVIVGYNTRGAHLSTFGLDMHNMWTPANTVPILALDVYEHAYMVDYGIDRGKYLDAFVKNIDWNVVAKRLAYSRKHPSGQEST
ncbi:MAG TPA: Fe-Mn family superoxide dismutase [Planktothrix sp.]|jgi:Fe-Mn family superoxide dismutase